MHRRMTHVDGTALDHSKLATIRFGQHHEAVHDSHGRVIRSRCHYCFSIMQSMHTAYGLLCVCVHPARGTPTMRQQVTCALERVI